VEEEVAEKEAEKEVAEKEEEVAEKEDVVEKEAEVEEAELEVAEVDLPLRALPPLALHWGGPELLYMRFMRKKHVVLVA